MGDKRTAWHRGFADYIESEKLPGVVIEREVVLAEQQRADLILIRRPVVQTPPTGPLRRFWEILPPMALIEYKSRSRRPRPGDLHQLLGYGHILARNRFDEVPQLDRLGLILAAPGLSDVLKRDLERFEVKAEPLGDGLYAVPGLGFPTWILSLDEMSDATGRGALGFFGSQRLESLNTEGRGWLGRYYMANIESIKELPDYEEMEEALARSEVGKRIFRKWMQFATAAELHADIEQLPEDMKSELRRRLLGDSES